MSDLLAVTLRVRADGRPVVLSVCPIFDGQILRRAWRRAGRPVVTVEGVYSSGSPNGRRVVIDLETGRGPLDEHGMADQIWFWGRTILPWGRPAEMLPHALDLAGVRAWWREQRGGRS